VKGANGVGEADDHAGPIVGGGGAALAAEHEKAGGVGGIVLDVVVKDAKVAFGGEGTGDGRAVTLTGGQFGCARGGGGFDDFDGGQMVLKPAAALGEGLGMGVELADFRLPTTADEAVLDGRMIWATILSSLSTNMSSVWVTTPSVEFSTGTTP
jgi:hypothetical protein